MNNRHTTLAAYIAAEPAATTRKQLQQLSKAELVAIILQLQARVAELEAQVKRLSGPPKDHTNSSIPPSQSLKPNQGGRSNTKRSPKNGHHGHGHKRQQPDVTVEYRPHRCARCGADLTDVPARLLGISQVVELPPSTR